MAMNVRRAETQQPSKCNSCWRRWPSGRCDAFQQLTLWLTGCELCPEKAESNAPNAD
jgi:hypothetical protein